MHHFRNNLRYLLLSGFYFFWTVQLNAQHIKGFYYAEPKTGTLPVFIRGNISLGQILLYIQGGSAEKGIDFGRSDYPRWKKSLERQVAIAYFDQRGLNQRIKQIDTTRINSEQICADIFTIARLLKEKYKAKIYLFGHSSGGSDVLDCLAGYPQESALITAGIAMHAPITTDFSPERYTYYRPLYLKNLAREKISQEKDTIYWNTALQWMEKTDSIHDATSSRRWNNYVGHAYQSSERKITPGMLLKVIFSAPYNPLNYLYKKDERLVGDILWRADRHLNRWPLLPEITKPILLLSGRYDPIATIEEQEAAHELIPNSELIIIPNSKHWSFLDQPAAFHQAVLNFLKKQ